MPAPLSSSLPALAQSKEPILIGVSGPLTGQYAQYGAQWKKGFDLALDEINAAGGIKGRPLQYVFEDTQSDPRQTVTIARKYVADERIVVEVGDFSSAASMAASPIYQAAGLVQFGFTNSHPDFTKGGDFIWSNAVNQKDEMPLLADFAARSRPEEDRGAAPQQRLGPHREGPAASRRSSSAAARWSAAKAIWRTRRISAPRSCGCATPIRTRIALISYYPDGAQITRQIRQAGITQPIVAGGSIYSPKFLELGGDAVNGVLTTVPFFPDDPRPVVQKFVKSFEAKFGAQPDAYNGRAYDTFILLAEVMRQFGTDRKAIKEGLGKIKDVPSVVYGKVAFDPATRRVADPFVSRIVVKDGKWAAYEGAQAAMR